MEQLEAAIDRLELRTTGLEENKSELERYRAEAMKLRGDLHGDKIRHGKTMGSLHHLQELLAIHKKHCRDAHTCCYDPTLDMK